MTRRSDAGRGALEDLAVTRQSSAPPSGDPISELELVLERVRRLRYDHNNPERFHAERSDIAGSIGGLLKRMRGIHQPRATASLPPLQRAGRPSTGWHDVDRPARPLLHLKAAHAARD